MGNAAALGIKAAVTAIPRSLRRIRASDDPQIFIGGRSHRDSKKSEADSSSAQRSWVSSAAVTAIPRSLRRSELIVKRFGEFRRSHRDSKKSEAVRVNYAVCPLLRPQSPRFQEV